jgi:ADP-ribose pyrophosphatase
MEFKTTASEYISRHQYFTARKDAYTTPDGKNVDPYFVVELPMSVCAMAITAENEVILVEQYRHPIGQKIMELPGGFIDDGEDVEKAIARELLEETGYSFDHFEYLGETAANPGVLNNMTKLYLATGGRKTAEQSLDENEEIVIYFKPLQEVRQMLMQNKIVQSMHALCMFYAFTFLDEKKK